MAFGFYVLAALLNLVLIPVLDDSWLPKVGLALCVIGLAYELAVG